MAEDRSRGNAVAAFSDPFLRRALSAPTQPVAVSRCMTYGPELLPALDKMFDQLGGLGRLVKGKTVAMKINLTGAPSYRVGHCRARTPTTRTRA